MLKGHASSLRMALRNYELISFGMEMWIYNISGMYDELPILQFVRIRLLQHFINVVSRNSISL